MDQQSDFLLSMPCAVSHLHKWSSSNLSIIAIAEKVVNAMVCSFATGATIRCSQNQMQRLDSSVNSIAGHLRSARLSEQVISNHETKG